MKKSLAHKVMAKIVRSLDPRFDRFREKPIVESEKAREREREEHRSEIEQAIQQEHENYIPNSEKELVQLIRRTPREIISIKDRNLISGAMSFRHRKASLIMMPREDITFLKDDDFLGPVNLDKLYKTGETIFPVLNKAKKVCGLIRTDKLDLLHITKDQPVTKLMEHDVAFAREDYSLEQLLAVFLRNHTDYVLIIDQEENLIGYAELATLVSIIFNRDIHDDFTDDSSSTAVSRRNLDE